MSLPDTSSWLVATKLHPPLMRADTIRRPRLEEMFSRAVSTLPLTLLSAPAGYGKTTMLGALPRLLPDHPVAWVTLDTEDNDPIRFVGLLAAALQRLHPDCGRSAWPWLTGAGAEVTALKRAVGALINDVLEYLPAPLVLVLDDLHFVTEPSIFVALEYLLDHQPPQLHIAVGTRHDPPLRLVRLAARRQLAELRRSDLGFSPDEAHQLLNETLGLSLTGEEVAALQERTEGWPAGLCLLAGPLGRLESTADRTQFMAAVGRTERYALDFLAEEVLRSLPEDLRRFLMQTSVLAEMTPSACRVVTGRTDADEVLEALYRQNLTIASITSEAEGEPVYRHHALFARLLTRQLGREAPGEVVELHRRAAKAQKTPGRVIAHYLAAGLWEEAAQVMLQSGMQLLHRGMAETVRSWYSALPAHTRTAHPRLGILVGRCEIHRGDYAAAGVLLGQARADCAAAGDAAGEGEALASLITLTYQNDDRTAAAAYVERALTLPLSPLGQVAARLGRAWLHLADCDWGAICADVRDALDIPRTTGDRRADLIGITYMTAPLAAVPGCLELTERYCAEAGALAPPDTAWRLAADELGTWPLLWRGRVDEALARAEAAEARRQQLGGYPFVGIDVGVQLCVLYTARGNLEAAGRAAESLVKRIETAARGKWGFYLHAAGRALALLGRHGEARTVWERLAALPAPLPLTAYLTQHLAGLLAVLEGRRHAEAAAALERAARLEAELPIAWTGGSARLLQARLLLEQGRPEAAQAAANPVLREWERAGTPGCILLDGPAVLPVLRLGGSPLLRYFPQPAAAPGPGPVAAPLAEPLTQRELDVLKLIVAGRTNRQIGEELYITEETVKTHVVRILRKLDVTSRTQAAIRGREMGL
ncbi:MAG TPA: LuxR C-terminal-related transcriptional regulator [Symbiobacteriaceae bacterium]|nr:LuxR C-terminal-related transcriptional regulator [Symbiobacteriaceae bacterium]